MNNYLIPLSVLSCNENRKSGGSIEGEVMRTGNHISRQTHLQEVWRGRRARAAACGRPGRRREGNRGREEQKVNFS